MRHYRNLLVIPAIALSFCMGHTAAACASEAVSGNFAQEDPIPAEDPSDVTVSEDVIPGESVSDNTVSENSVSENDISGDEPSAGTVSENIIPGQKEDTVSRDAVPVKEPSGIKISHAGTFRDGRVTEIRINVESTVSKIVKVEAENKAVGIRKKLYHRSEGSYDSSIALKLRVNANGCYVFRAVDSDGNSDTLEVRVDDIGARSFSGYTSRAQSNVRGLAPTGTLTCGSCGAKTGKVSSGAKNYQVKSGKAVNDAKDHAIEDYSRWSLLKRKERKDEEKLWYEPAAGSSAEPDAETGAEGAVSDSLPGLSDYGIKLFRTEALGDGAFHPVVASGLTETEVMPGLKFTSRDDNIGTMDSNNSMIIIGVVIFIIILLMLAASFLLLKGHKDEKSKKKVKVRIKRVAKSTSGRTGTSGKSGTSGKNGTSRKTAASAKKGMSVKTGASVKPAASGKAGTSAKSPASKPVPLRSPGDEGIEKYARMTEDYVRSKFGIELKRIDLKKYYSDRHGFDCVDFTYSPASGVLPAQFRMHLNDVDTALSNVSGVDTITFAVDNSTGTYRTTFYLGG